MANEDLKRVWKRFGIYQWEIAGELGVSDITVSRWLRYELPQEKKELILAAIEKIKEARRNG